MPARLDPDDLGPVEWDTLEAIEAEPLDPNNTPLGRGDAGAGEGARMGRLGAVALPR
ncbi:MAG: hypothetical protein ACR2NB_13945 [Solirubrobacteraceae bacterium]